MNFPIAAHTYLAAIVSSTDDVIISKDLNGNITFWNPAAERVLGYTAQEAVGRHISLIIPPDRMGEEEYILSQIRQGRRIEHFETMRRAKDGHLVNLSITISPIRESDGTIIGASKIARDITDLKKAERAHSYLSAIVESSDDAIISKDLNGIITSWNKSAERIFGFKAEEIIGHHITMIIPPDRLSEEGTIINALKAGKRIDHFETLRRHRDGHLIPVSITVSPIFDKAGNIIGASKVSRDISDRTRAEQAVKEAHTKRDEFLANMSHELRTPMNAVIGLSSILQTMDLPPKAKQYVDTIKISANSLMDLINDLLDFAKLDSCSIQLERIEFNLLEQIEKVISVANVKAAEKGLRLFVDYEQNLNRYFIGDPLRIHQILMNVISNAVKFTDSGSIEMAVTGTVDESNESAMLTFKVSDTGIGISKENLESIFEKFMQADASITRRFGGSGLGLAITKALVETMGGKIQVESELGVGTVFSVTLPLQTTRKASDIENLAPRKSTPSPVKRKDVLLVEDYEPNLMVASTLLETLGYSFDIARNGFEALRKFVHAHYGVILMDVQMNELDGIEATCRIRRIEQEKELAPTPIIAMTAHVREQDKNQCLSAGMNDFVPKPFELQALARKLAHYLNNGDDDNGKPHLVSNNG